MLKLTRRRFLQFLSLLPSVTALPDARAILLTRSVAESLPEHHDPFEFGLAPFALVIDGQSITAKDLSVETVATTIRADVLGGDTQRSWYGPISNRLYVTSNDDRCRHLRMCDDPVACNELVVPIEFKLPNVDWRFVCMGHLNHVSLECGYNTLPLWALDFRLSDLTCAT